MTVVSERRSDLGRVLIEHDRWRVHELELTLEKTKWLWEQMQKYRTLFSDFTRGDVQNFYDLIALRDSFWLEVVDEQQQTVGIVYWTGMAKTIDVDVHFMFFDWRWVNMKKLSAEEKEGTSYFTLRTNDPDVHLVFFDRQPAEKVELCKTIARWFFKEYPQAIRMTATLPEIYHATIRLAFKIGFTREGRKRRSQLMGGRYIDELVFGLLSSEIQ